MIRRQFKVKNKTIIGLKYTIVQTKGKQTIVKNKTIIGLKF